MPNKIRYELECPFLRSDPPRSSYHFKCLRPLTCDRPSTWVTVFNYGICYGFCGLVVNCFVLFCLMGMMRCILFSPLMVPRIMGPYLTSQFHSPIRQRPPGSPFRADETKTVRPFHLISPLLRTLRTWQLPLWSGERNWPSHDRGDGPWTSAGGIWPRA